MVIFDTDVVELELHVLNTDDTYVRMVNFIDSAVKNAAKGTPLEGRINVVLVADEDYYDNNEAGQCDMIFDMGRHEHGSMGHDGSLLCKRRPYGIWI